MVWSVNINQQIGYCGNVHPALSIDQLIDNLQQHTTRVKHLLGKDLPMPFGIWLSETALSELHSPKHLQRLKDTLNQLQLIPFTVNGFPFGDFHQPVVKHSVYLPDWTDARRLNYTLQLADLHHQLLPAETLSTISTLPLGWPGDGAPTSKFFQRCAKNLATCATELQQRFESTGRRHLICIEPEPGCVLDCCTDMVEFFQQYLFPNSKSESAIRNHIGICHDVCHSAVMFESQEEAIRAYCSAGIAVGKIQVSSALEVNFDQLNQSEAINARKQLATFVEPKYLHQTTIQNFAGEREFYVDLPDALAANQGTGVWRVHFHVPIFYEGSAAIGTTQQCISQCLAAINTHDINVDHFEVETYAWPVLPAGIFTDSIDEGIAKEIRWFENLLSQE